MSSENEEKMFDVVGKSRQQKTAQRKYFNSLAHPNIRPHMRTPSPTPGEDHMIDATPAPGEYIPPPYLGLRSRTPPHYSFPKQDRDREQLVYQGLPSTQYVVSPGPGAFDTDQVDHTSPGRRFAPGPHYVSGFDINRRAEEMRRPSPGPGEYDIRSETFKGRSCTFGSGDRTEPFIASAASSVEYPDAEKVMAGDRIRRPASPSFTFGTGAFQSFGGNSTSNEKRNALDNRPTTPFAQRPRTSHKASGLASKGRPKTSSGRRFRKPPKNNNYDWIYGNHKSDRKGDSRGGISSFGSGARELFTRGEKTPGPDHYQVGPVPGAIGADFARYENSNHKGMMPGFAFAKSSDRAPSDIKEKKKDNKPGPGAYNIQLEHRISDMFRDDSKMIDGVKTSKEKQQPRLVLEIPSQEVDDIDRYVDSSASIGGLTSVTSASRSAKSHWSLEESFQGRSAQFVAAELGLKFGDIPTSPMAPSYSFGSGNREGRAKLFHGQDELSTSTTDSPGPNTAKSNMPYADGRPGSRSYTMLGANMERNPIPFQNNNVGPARLGQFSCVGPDSIYKSPAPSFGVSTRGQIQKLFMGPGF